MSYAAAIERLYALAGELHTAPGAPRRKFRLEDVRVLLAALGDPQRRFPSVLIAGTNGKGSTAATLAAILRSAGYRTGLYTSPHLVRPNERIQIDGAPIPDHAFAEAFFRVEAAAQSLINQSQANRSPMNRVPHSSQPHRDEWEPALSATPSFFETMTAMAFLYFAGETGAESPIDIAILEVGLGGRLDATNVVDPLLSIITDISLDHTEWLGPTIDAIAREKAGILRPGGVMITLPQHPEASNAIGEAAIALGVRAVNAAAYIPVHQPSESSARNRYPLTVLGEQITVDSPLAGHHQQRNIALAIAAAVELSSPDLRYTNNPTGRSGYNITAADIENGIRSTEWPGRLEHVPASDNHAEVLLDVAHNPAGTWALRSAVSTLLDERGRPLILVFGCLRDKAIAEMAQILFPLFDQVVIVPVDSPRAATLNEMLAAAAPTGAVMHPAPDAAAALLAAFDLTPPDGLIVVAGSVHLVGHVRDILVRNILLPATRSEPAQTSASQTSASQASPALTSPALTGSPR